MTEPVRKPLISVIVCARNEEARIGRALECVLANEPAEVIVVDGGSEDDTVAIAERYGVRVIRSGGKGLAYDRQLGADAARHKLVCFIDADHRPRLGAIDDLAAEMAKWGFDAIQAGVGIEDHGFWCRAENDAFAVFHHQPGPRKQMIGVAPAIFTRDLIQTVRFDEENPLVSDDADLFRRIVAADRYTFGVGAVIVPQEHHGAYADYVSKFRWYGRMDAEFMVKHPDRAGSMLFHLMVRYPIWRPIKALAMGKPRAIPYFWLCGGVRLRACLTRLAARALGRARAQAEAGAGA